MTTVTQADRQNAVSIRIEFSSRGISPEVNGQFLRDTIDGGHDDDWLVLLCARHREAAFEAGAKHLREVIDAADKMRVGIRKAGVKREPDLYQSVMVFDAARKALDPAQIAGGKL